LHSVCCASPSQTLPFSFPISTGSTCRTLFVHRLLTPRRLHSWGHAANQCAIDQNLHARFFLHPRKSMHENHFCHFSIRISACLTRSTWSVHASQALLDMVSAGRLHIEISKLTSYAPPRYSGLILKLIFSPKILFESSSPPYQTLTADTAERHNGAKGGQLEREEKKEVSVAAELTCHSAHDAAQHGNSMLL